MGYRKTVWKNRSVEKPRTFQIRENDDGTVTLIPAEGSVTEPGTPIIATTMNNMEDAIEELFDSKVYVSAVPPETPKADQLWLMII